MGAFGDNEGERKLFDIILFPILFTVAVLALLKGGDFGPLARLFGLQSGEPKDEKK